MFSATLFAARTVHVPAAFLAAAFLLVSCVFTPAAAQTTGSDPGMASYYDQAFFLSAPPAAFGDGLYGSANPAVASLVGSDLAFAWSSDGTDLSSVQEWGVFSNMGGLSSSYTRLRRTGGTANAYHIGLSEGNRSGAFGIAYQFYTGDATALGRYNRIVTGTVLRPVRYLSIGGIGNFSVETDDWEAVAEIGIRPLGTSRVTLFADAAVQDGQAVKDALWSAGGSVEVVDGVQLFARFFEDERQSFGLRLDLGRTGIESGSTLDAGGDYAGQTSRVRAGSFQPSVVYSALARDRQRLELNLSGSLPYRTSRLAQLFGSGQTRFYDVLRSIQDATETGTVRQIALNLTGVQLGTAKAWELRRALRAASERGIQVVVYFENAEMTDYYLASAADVLVADPQGTLALPGYALSRTYLDGTLDKIGLEFDEWRFFEYKSAAETLSRKDFSDADSTQRAEYLSDIYDTVTQGIASRRGISRDTLNDIIDTRTILRAPEAQALGLVDSLARWHDREEFLEALAGSSTRAVKRDDLAEVAAATRTWSEPDKIAVVYGIGPTSMESGIQARTLHKTIRSLKDRRDVAGVVFRVDSPGGDGLASDLVAEALREVAEEKPVIVSQGQVAGSGGYWISAYADTILATPATVTGSIGVIGGWLYADGWSEKTGQTYDVVKEGQRADLFTGYQLPLGGPQIPARPLASDERERVEEVFQAFYSEFVTVVATGRDTTEAHIREVGEGRIYSGLDGRAVGLVDEIGGMEDAIRMARRAAGLDADRFEVVEVNPQSGFWDLAELLPFPFRLFAGGSAEETAARSPSEAFIWTVLHHQPGPIVMLPPGTYLTDPVNTEPQ